MLAIMGTYIYARLFLNDIEYAFTWPLHTSKIWHKVNLKTSYHTNVKEPSLPDYLPISGERIYTFPESIGRNVKFKLLRFGFDLGSLGLFPATMTVTP